MNLNGLHLANGAQDVDELLGLGFRCFTYLDGQRPEAERIRAAASDALLVCRLYRQNFLLDSPKLLAQALATTGASDVIPWNEANLPYETGGEFVGYQRLASYWSELVHHFQALNTGQRLHFPAWSPYDGNVGAFWPGADVYDLHLYGKPSEMIAHLDRCLEHLPADTPVFISEWNFGRPWSEAPTDWIDLFLSGLASRHQVIGATAFIWRWENPDSAHPNYDLIGTPAAAALGAWLGPTISITVGGYMSIDASLKEQHPDQFDAWWNAGGWRNFASFLVATGQISASDAEKRDLVKDRLSSGVNETTSFLDSLPLA